MSATVPGLEYAPALEPAGAIAFRKRYGLLIGGVWAPPEKDASSPALDPATEAPLTSVAVASAADVDKAVRAARRGYDKYWCKLRPAERAKYLFRIAAALDERLREIALVETLGSGRPIRTTLEHDAPHAAATIFYHAGWADKLEWAARPLERARALGVVGAIVSSEASLLGAARKLAPALACGNTLVLKPANATPLDALLLGQICVDAALPPGVVNVVTGDAKTAVALVDHPDVDAIAFSGAANIGKAIARAAAATPKRLSLTLSGQSTVVVYEDAPLDQAIEGIVAATGARLLVQESVLGDVLVRLGERLKTLRHGNPLDRNTDVGPLPSRKRRDALAALVARAQEQGAQLVQAAWQPPERGFWFPASYAIETFRTVDESLERAGASRSGFTAALWTLSGQLALYAARWLRAGVIWCNAFDRFDPSAPFGGYREFGSGRDGGLAGLREYLQV